MGIRAEANVNKSCWTGVQTQSQAHNPNYERLKPAENRESADLCLLAAQAVKDARRAGCRTRSNTPLNGSLHGRNLNPTPIKERSQYPLADIGPKPSPGCPSTQNLFPSPTPPPSNQVYPSDYYKRPHLATHSSKPPTPTQSPSLDPKQFPSYLSEQMSNFYHPSYAHQGVSERERKVARTSSRASLSKTLRLGQAASYETQSSKGRYKSFKAASRHCESRFAEDVAMDSSSEFMKGALGAIQDTLVEFNQPTSHYFR